MLVIINSAKTQNYAPLNDLPVSQPPLLDKTRDLVSRCQQMSREEIRAIMKVSEKIADTTFSRFQDFIFPHHQTSSSPVLSTFAGDIFSEIRYHNFTREDFLYAHERVRILSGLYGILRPLDLMQLYRLEMGYKMKIGEAANLYDFWSEAVTTQLNQDLQSTGSSIILNCASKEYSRTVLPRHLDGTILTLTFKQKKNGSVRSIAIYAKRARGMFVDWFITRRIASRRQLKEFDRSGYHFVEELSSETELVFITDLDS